MSAASGTRAIVAALAANLGIAITKFIAFLLTASSSMLAESIHSVADSGNQALLLLGGKRARREADSRHPFGYGRERYIYAFIVAIILFSVGGLFALYEGIHKLQHREPIESWQWVPITVLVVAIGLESFSFRTAIVESNHVRGDASWIQFIRHSRVPELPVVLLEDLAALIGLVFALFGVSLTLMTGDGLWDGVATVLIGLLLVVVAIVLAIETKSLLLGESATAEHVGKIEQAIVDGGDIERIIHMKTLHVGPEELLVAVKVGVPGASTSAEVAAAIDAAEARIREAVPIARVIYIEPDIYRPAAADKPPARKDVRRLDGPIREYAWGSRTFLAGLQGRPVPSAQPEAELWLGAHPAAPSHVDGVPLTSVVAADPHQVLGPSVVARFGPRLPFLLKVLAASEPLSLQAHPDAQQARAGYAVEEAVGGGRVRNYVDPFHKPELLVALGDFDALCGFRAPALSAQLLASFEVRALARVVAVLRTPYPGPALRAAVELIMHWPDEERSGLVEAVGRAGAKRCGPDEPAYALAGRLAEQYPGDVGVVLALLLNQVQLRADEAVYMPAGNLHAYLRGNGVEVMASSDNVLRGGLTRKRVDVDELLRVLRYEVLPDPVLRPVPVAPGVVTWPTPAEEFTLLKATAAGGEAPVTLPGAGPRVVTCLAGLATISAGDAVLELAAGQSAFVTAAEPMATLTAATSATVFQARPAA